MTSDTSDACGCLAVVVFLLALYGLVVLISGAYGFVAIDGCAVCGNRDRDFRMTWIDRKAEHVCDACVQRLAAEAIDQRRPACTSD